jgi:hypothetical protein
MRKLGLTLLLVCAPALGQLATDTITITANRQISLQPDEIVFGVQVSAADTAGIDDVLAMVPGTGIMAANLTGVFSNLDLSVSVTGITWIFALPVTLSQASATTTLLTQLERQSGQAVSFYVQGAQVSQALQQSQPCSQASLVSDAQTQAQNLAAASGFTVGPVLAVSDGSLAQQPASVVSFVGSFAVLGLVNSLVAVPPPFPSTPTCTAVVKFQLYRFH